MLIERGATFRFDTKVEGFLTRGGGERGAIRGLKLAGGGEIVADRCGFGRVLLVLLLRCRRFCTAAEQVQYDTTGENSSMDI